ncbi:hypothetical protein L1D14_25535 [Vibrio tubiashii]|uniref:hypothetical protein n=1 Tax=Vibrio tubiashii TaxID=29498 RepID=UPI001EFD28DE|nr:hypothetical protein [Vibrio tubiashii]MCG9579574.1 hypothetical protein [Vibrio tubiashii]
MRMSPHVSSGQQSLIVVFLVTSLVLVLVSQLAGIVFSVFCLFLARRLRSGWDAETRGSLALPSYISAIGLASVRFYGYIALGIILLISYLDPTFLADLANQSSIAAESQNVVHSEIPIIEMLVAMSGMGVLLLMYVLTLLRLACSVWKDKPEVDGGFITTVIWMATGLVSMFTRTFSKKPLKES